MNPNPRIAGGKPKVKTLTPHLLALRKGGVGGVVPEPAGQPPQELRPEPRERV